MRRALFCNGAALFVCQSNIGIRVLFAGIYLGVVAAIAVMIIGYSKLRKASISIQGNTIAFDL